MGKRDKFGRFIEGVTDLHDREYFERYLKGKRWEDCCKWLHAEVCWLHNKVIRARIIYNLFGLLETAVLTFFTWVLLWPDLSATEREAYKLADICKGAFGYLCETVPYGKPAVIGGLLCLPFVVCSVLALILLPFSSKKFYKKFKTKSQLSFLSRVKRKLERLEKEHNKYIEECYLAILYAVLGGLATGGVMIVRSGGQEFLKCLFMGAVFTIIYGLCIWVVAFIYSRVLDSFGVKYYPFFTWLIDVNLELGERQMPDEETPVEIPDPEEEKRIKDFLDGIMDDLSGRGFGKGL